jgi:hypothetical protein
MMFISAIQIKSIANMKYTTFETYNHKSFNILSIHSNDPFVHSGLRNHPTRLVKRVRITASI